MPDFAIATIIFLFGLCIGSFLNVCIRRIPAEQSVVRPASRCPKCGAGIKPYDNIPVVSYLLLAGKCRNCRAPISPLYPAVELLTALLFVACYLTFGPALAALKWALFCALLVVLVFTDIFERILPDPVNFGGLAAGLAISLAVPVNDGTARWLSTHIFEYPPPDTALSLIDSILGASVLSLLLWLFGEVFSRIIKRDALGFGDVKMMAMMGAFVGLKGSMLIILAGSFLGSVIGAAVILAIFLFSERLKRAAARASRRGLGSPRRIRWILARRYQLPFGTFLGAGALFTVFFGPAVIAWYRQLLN